MGSESGARRGASALSATAEVTVVKDRTVMLRPENGRVLDMRKDDPQLRHVDRA